MNEINLGAVPIEPAPDVPSHKDRKAGLIVFGILTCLLGCLVALAMLLMVAGILMGGPSANAVPVSSMLLAVAMYGVLAAILIWLGIGSILARRWARALLLVWSWFWLIVGLIMVPVMAFLMPKTFANMPGPAGQPPVPMGAIMVGMMLFLGLFFIIIPGIWVLFYGSRHVKATCETRDPAVRWTDSCPLPVLAVCLWLAVSVPIMAFMPIAGFGVFPFFGNFITGFPGGLFYILIAIIWAYGARSLYKLDIVGWWVVFITLFVFTVSSLLTYARHDAIEMYQLMHLPQVQIDQMQKSGVMTRNNMTTITAAAMAPFLGYLWYIKRYMQHKA